MEDESSTALPDRIVHEAETTRSGDTGEITPTDLEAVGNLFDEVLTGKVTVEEACMSQKLTRIIERLDVKKQRITDGHLVTPHPSNVCYNALCSCLGA